MFAELAELFKRLMKETEEETNESVQNSLSDQ